MSMFIKYWLLLVGWIFLSSRGVRGQKVGLRSDLGFGCFNCALYWNFNCPNEVLPFNCRCSRDDFLTTAMNCVVENAKNVREIDEGWNYIRSQCHYWGNRSLSLEQLQSIYEENKNNIVDPSSFNASLTTAPGPVSVPSNMIARQLVSAHDTKYHYNVGNYFAWTIIGYWGAVVVGGIVTNAIRITCPNAYNLVGAQRVTKVRKFFTLPALIGKNHHSPYRFMRYITVRTPTRGQFFIILGFVALNIASIVSFLKVEGDSPIGFTSQSDRKLHYLANRTGIIAFGHIPVLVLFACRNNPLIYLTGWPYDIFMMYHRWCARSMGIHAIIHAVAIYWSSINEKVVLFKWNNVHNWRGGNIAVYMVIAMLTLGIRSIRSRIYETFKATHVVMFLIFIICLIVHCSDYGWLGWLWTAIIFYAIEYGCRVSAVILSGGVQNAEFSLTNAGMYRVRVPMGGRKWSIKPGAYVYIRILDKNMFWQSHPFSIFQGYKSQQDDSLDMCCKAQLGATRKVLDKLLAAPDKKLVQKVMIEGPYGNENYVCDYESILLFAGGVGFTAMYNFASHIVERLKKDQRLYLFWVVKDCQQLKAFEDEIAYLARQGSDMCIFRIFVTSPAKLGTVAMAESPRTVNSTSTTGSFPNYLSQQRFSSSKITLVGASENEGEEIEYNSGNHDRQRTKTESAIEREDECLVLVDGDIILHIEYGRPDISAGISDFIKTASGRKAICSCGPPMFVDAIRDGIVESILHSDNRVDYFEDAFSW